MYHERITIRKSAPTMSVLDEIQILPYETKYQAAVKDLILTGLGEHWGWIDLTKNPDLDDIGAAYAGAVFLVAVHHDRVVGTGALVPRAGETAEVVRMSVARDFRRKGVGRLILQALCETAGSQGLRRVTLETTAAWMEVIEFYLRSGFRITHYQDGDVYFALDLRD
jgi:GNAT superfamily N-acetyltransferase